MKISSISLVLGILAAGCDSDDAVVLDLSGAGVDLSAAADLSAVPDLSGPVTQSVTRTQLVADTSDNDGATIDPNLVNAWGLAFNPAGPVWIADNHTGVATVYSAAGVSQSLVVTIPPPTGSGATSAPTGQVYNGTVGFFGDKLIFSTEDGTISGWQSGTAATLRVDRSAATTIYKGLAILTQGSATRIYATDFHNGRVDVFDNTYTPFTTSGGFTDSAMPAGFAPFGIQAIGTSLYVTYAMQDVNKMDDTKGPGNGYVNVFDFDGTLTKRFTSAGPLNSPWGVALAPASFGSLGGALLVGNFGDGKINAFKATTGEAITTLTDATGAPLVIDGLWALQFGPDTMGAAHNQLFYTAGPGDETHGVFGRLDAL